jgi:putative ABC transport system permease protein
MSRDRPRRLHRLKPAEDVERELQAHLAQRTEELIAEGWDADAARAEAERLFGDVPGVRRECSRIAERRDRSLRRTRMWSELTQDLRYATRWLVREPGFALLAIFTLALGIGANSAAFGIVNGVLLAPLPYPDAHELVAVWEQSESGVQNAVTWPNFSDWRRDTHELSSMAAYQHASSVTVLGGAEPVRASVARVTASLFDVLRVRPLMGRLWHAAELTQGGQIGVLVSHSYWRDQLSSTDDLSLVKLDITGASASVIGVLPAGFSFPRDTEIWAPLDIENPAGLGDRTAHNFRAIARLTRGSTPARAQDELNVLTQRIREAEPDITAVGAVVTDLRDDTVGSARRGLFILLGASAFVLLVACTNLASALLARTARRAQELAVRASLGAPRMRLVRQLLTESLLLAVLGAAAGIGFAFLLIEVAVTMGANAVPRLAEVRLDGSVLAFTTVLAVATALTFGTLPALRATTSQPYDALREGARGTDSPARRRGWSMLIGAEVALALLLLVGSGLMIRSFTKLMQVDPGFDTADQLAVRVSLPGVRYADGTARTQFYDELLERVRVLPGVAGASVTMTVPLVDSDPNGLFHIEGGEIGDGDAAYRVIGTDFFTVMGTRVVEGRTFTATDRANAEDVVIINESLARRYFPDGNAIGKRMRTGGMDTRGSDFATIIGIAEDVRFRGLDAPPRTAYYLHYPQRTDRLRDMTLLVRSPRPERLANEVRATIRQLDPDIAVDIATLEARIGEGLADRRFMLLVLGAFAGIALMLSAIGIYGVVSYAVAQRTREIGIRMALGAAATRVLWSVGRSTITSIVIGLAVGVVAALLLARLTTSFLYGVEPTDPATFAGVVLLLFIVGWVAVLVPARRATRITPMIALRAE